MLRTFPSVARFCFLALLIALTIMPCASLAQSALDGFDPNANGGVQAIVVQPDGKILIGGAFTTLNGGTVARNRIARLNVDGSVDSSFDPNAERSVEAIALQPDGKIILGGGFTTLNGGAVTRNCIARLNTDGSVDSTFDPNINGSGVYALAVQPDGKILLGGFFTTLNGGAITRNYIARLNSDGSVDTAFNPNADFSVYSIALQSDGKILLGGNFTTFNGGAVARNSIARLNSDGSVDVTFNPNADSLVYALAVQPDGKILLGGAFTTLNGGAITRNYIARLNTNGSVDSAFDPNVDSVVYTIARQADGKILLGGYFTTLNGGSVTRNHIARLNIDASVDSTFNPNADAAVYAVAVQSDGGILMGGLFGTLNGGATARGHIARLTADGSVDSTLNPDANSGIIAIALQPDGKILVGGDFTALHGGAVARNHIARLNVDGSVDGIFDPNANDLVQSVIVQPDGKILVGGYFTTLNGGSVTRNHIARLNADGSVDSTFDPNVNNTVYTIAVQSDGKILLGGVFTSLNGGATVRNHLARLNPDGSVDTTFDPNANRSVYAIAFHPDGKILLGGFFTTLNAGAVLRNYIARLNADGSVDSTFDPNANDSVRSFVVQPDGKILVGGDFRTLNSGAVVRNFIARLNADGSVDSSFLDPNPNSNVTAITLQLDGKILLGGGFFSLNSGAVARNCIARLNSDGSVDSTFDLAVGRSTIETVFAIAVQPDGKILLGGEFSSLNSGAVTRHNFARVSASGSALQSFDIVGYTAGGSLITWRRSGTGPELALSPYLLSSLDGTAFTLTGTMQRVSGGWRYTDFVPPMAQNFYLRTRGRIPDGYLSSGLIENTYQLYLNSAEGIFHSGFD